MKRPWTVLSTDTNPLPHHPTLRETNCRRTLLPPWPHLNKKTQPVAFPSRSGGKHPTHLSQSLSGCFRQPKLAPRQIQTVSEPSEMLSDRCRICPPAQI